MADQTEQAINEADGVIFLVDVRDGLHALDFHIADRLRRSGQTVCLAVNKAEGMRDTAAGVDFYELGLGEPHLISAAHGDGVASWSEGLLEQVSAQPAALARGVDEEAAE